MKIGLNPPKTVLFRAEWNLKQGWNCSIISDQEQWKVRCTQGRPVQVRRDTFLHLMLGLTRTKQQSWRNSHFKFWNREYSEYSFKIWKVCLPVSLVTPLLQLFSWHHTKIPVFRIWNYHYLYWTLINIRFVLDQYCQSGSGTVFLTLPCLHCIV